MKANKDKHILTFCREVCNFINKQNTLMDLVVDSESVSEDVMDDPTNCPNSLIAGMENDISEMMDKLKDYYKSTGNKRCLKRLIKISNNYHFNNQIK